MQIVKGSNPGAKTKRHARDCQRCGRRFEATRIVSYCRPCFLELHGGRYR